MRYDDTLSDLQNLMIFQDSAVLSSAQVDSPAQEALQSPQAALALKLPWQMATVTSFCKILEKVS